MTFDGLLIHAVDIVTFSDSTADRYGDATETEILTEARARIQARSSVELLEGRDTRISEYVALFPVGTIIDATSEVSYGAQRYRVVGPPKVANDAIGPHHIVADLERIDA